MKMTVKKAISFALVALMTVTFPFFAGCEDLGDYVPGESHEGIEVTTDAYYASYGDVSAIYCGEAGKYNVKKTSYNVEKSLYNPRTHNKLTWDPDEGDVEVAVQPYIYLALPIKRDMKIESLVLYVKAEKFEGYTSFDHSNPPIDLPDMVECRTTVSLFLLEDASGIPQHIKKFGDPDKEWVPVLDEHGNPKKDGDGNVIEEETAIVYDDPKDPICTRPFSYKKDKWNSFLMEKWSMPWGTDKQLQVYDGNVLLIRFENNTGYAKGVATKSYFTFLNLLIRAVE